jgi:hypothetical protein
MSKIYTDGKASIKYSELLPVVLESVIDSRYKYLKELDYENHTYARQILEKEYKPSLEKLKHILEIIA